MCWPHKWTVKDKEILPSLIEQADGQEFKIIGGTNPSLKPCIVTYVCKKCGQEKVVRV